MAKRVVLLLDPPSDAKSERKPVTVVLTVAAEGPGAGEAVPLEAFSPAEEPEERSPPSDDDDDEDDSAPNHRGRGPHAPPSSRDDGSDEDVAPPPGDHRVSTAKGARAKPLPAPPPPVQVKAVQWGDGGGGALRETRRLLVACCPCFVQADEFDRQLQ